MIGKFAIMMCPEPKCPKIGLTKDSECPEHSVVMVRTVVRTQASIDAEGNFTKSIENVLRDLGGYRK